MELSDIDVVSNDVYLDGAPHEQFAHLRAHAPVFLQKVPDPQLVDEVWVVTKPEHIKEVSFDTETYSSERNGCQLRKQRVKEGLRINAGNFINTDDPHHKRMRTMVSKAFTPKVIKTFADHYGKLTRRILDKALEQESFDFVTAVSAELPLLAISELLGVPEEDRWKIFSWSNAILGVDDPDYGGSAAEAGNAATELGAYALRLADARRRDPGDDILSMLATAPEHSRLTDAELEGFVLLLLVAGNETTRNNISHGLIALLGNPDQLVALKESPQELMTQAVEEITRWASPVNLMARTVTRDTELAGQTLREGDRVAMFYSSANRDEELFPGGDVFDITVPRAKHLAFGIGKHICLGAHLARIETEIMFTELLPRVQDIAIDEPVERVRSSFINGIKRLPVRVRRS